MANIKSSAKRDVKSKELRAKNRADKTELKTMMKKFDAAVAEGNRDNAVSAYKVAVKTVDRARQGSAAQEQCGTQEVRNGEQAQRDGLIEKKQRDAFRASRFSFMQQTAV